MMNFKQAEIQMSSITPLPTPTKGKADWRNYKAFQLENGVTCLVINDKESKTTAMSCVVNVGASADPREMSGLAHFCEHMCFLGSEKYPGENEYKRYLASHGGRSNASTSMHLTNYKFEVIADKAEKAVDIFSNFFVAPLFTSSGTSREVQAVDSENSKNLTADARRRLQILKALADPRHYFSKFSTGNSRTLPTNDPEKLDWIREALLAFHRKHYRPENMTVCIAGPQSIEILSEWVTSRYSQIKSQPFPASDQPVMTRVEQLVDAAARDAPPYTFQEKAPPYSPPFRSSLQGSWPVLLTTKPLRSMRKLVMMWPLPSNRKTPDRAPSSMLSHLLGHEGVGSAFAALQNAGLLSALSAGPRTKSPDFTLFQVDMTLTEKGEKNWQSVVNVIFAYCRLLATKASDNDGIETLKRIWGETSDLDRMFFHQTSPGGVYSYAPTIADRVVAHGTEACLSAGNMLNENKDTFPVEDFGKFAELLSPENCIIERCSESAYEEMQQQTNFDEGYGLQNEKWYGVEYFLSPIDSMSTSAWKGLGKLANPIETDELRLPSPNRYIPRTLELCPDLPQEARIGQRIEKPIDPPNLLIHDKNWKLYHRLDDRYALPQSSLHLLIRNIAVQSVKSGDEWTFDARASLLSSIVAGIFNEAMAQETYDADLAGLHWSMNATAAGIKLNCFGFSDRLPDLGLKVLSDFLSGDFLDERFFISSRDRVVRGLRTYFESRRADAHAMYYRDSLLATQDKGIDESLELAVSMKFEDVVQHHRAILKHNHVSAVDCLFSGNVSSRDAALFFAEARSKINSAQAYVGENNQSSQVVIPAPSIERLVNPGNEIQLHFASKNPAEENGAVLVTYQSSIPSFKGQVLSQPESLLSSSAIRLLCHMLREPLFDELRTKQQLGYIVSSYHEIGHSFCLDQSIQAPCTTPVDFISINILSRKVPPTQIIERIDEFLGNFRRSLETMPESEIKDHSDALATKLLKPIQKLQTESSSQFSRIQRYGPEVFSRNANSDDSIPGSSFDDGMPWETAPELAVTIRQLTRKDLLQVWDRMTQPSTRCRVVSCVYGKTFPLSPSNNDLEARGAVGFSSFWNQSNSVKVVNDFPNLLKLREGLPHYGPQGATISAGRKMYTRLGSLLKPDHRMKLVGIGVLGAAMIGSALVSTESNRKRRAPNGNAKMLASSVFFLVAMALPAIGTSSTTLPVAFLGTSLLCNAYTGQRPFERTKSVVVNGDDGVKSRVCQSWELDFSEQDIEETSSRAPSAIGRREVLLSMAAAALMYPTTAHGAEKRDRVQTKTLDDLQFGSARWSPLTDAFNNEDDENESLNGGTDRRNVKASQKADSGVSNIAVPASFATYLTRVLINYDEGVSSWWQSRLHSYSLLPFDQQQTRLGQDFGKLSASIQRALQGYMEDKAGATPPRNVYEDIFERLMRSVDGSLDKDEGKRQLLLLAATLPADHQPVGAIKELLANLSTRSALPPNQISNENVMKEDLSALLPETYTVISRSDGTVTLSPQVSFFEVGVGEEFGQAATATTFGPVAATELTRDLPQYTFDIYALFGISGATGCCLTHSLVIPLDVVKTKEQVWSSEEGYKSDILTGVNRILREEGVSGLLTGAQATLAGYFWYGLSVYPSYAFFKRYLSYQVLPSDLAMAHANDIALVAGALAAIIASLGLTPLEAARIRVVADPARYRPLGLIGTLETIASEGEGTAEGVTPWRNLYAGLPSLLTRQVIFGSVKFLAFERACEFIFHVWPFLRDTTWTSLSVSLVAGGFSGALSSVVSQPADAVLTYVAAMEQSSSTTTIGSLGVIEGSRIMVEEGGISALFRGLGSRCLWASAIIAGQFLLYDVFRTFFGVNSADLSQVFVIDLT